MTGQKDFIPFNGIVRQHHNLRYELTEAMHQVLDSGQMLDGRFLDRFQEKIALRTGREYAIAVNSGTNAIHYIFDYIKRYRELSFKEGNMGIAIPNFSFRSTRNCVATRGDIIPIDVDQFSGLMNLKETFGSRTIDVLMYANLFGNMIDYEELVTVVRLFLSNPNCIIIEDSCQSFGSTYKEKQSGSFGDFSTFSFDPTKNLGHSGGGMILTDDHAAAAWLYEYLRNGTEKANETRVNSIMDETNCAMLLVKLRYFDEWQKRRGEIAKYYNENLHDTIITPDHTMTIGVEPNWHKYVILSDRRESIKTHLAVQNIETKIHYSLNIDSMVVQPEFSNMGARTMSNNVLSLPIYPELTDAEVERIVEEVNKVMTWPGPMLRDIDTSNG